MSKPKQVAPFSVEDFASAPKGSKIKDANGNMWTFLNEPVPPNIPAKRFVSNCNGDHEEIAYTRVYNDNHIVDEEMGILVELNHPSVQLIS